MLGFTVVSVVAAIAIYVISQQARHGKTEQEMVVELRDGENVRKRLTGVASVFQSFKRGTAPGPSPFVFGALSGRSWVARRPLPERRRSSFLVLRWFGKNFPMGRKVVSRSPRKLPES